MEQMRFRLPLVLAALSVAVHVTTPRLGSGQAAQRPGFVPVTDAVLQKPAAADWLRWRRDHGATGYSPLNQVDRRSVQRLRLAWAWPMSRARRSRSRSSTTA